MTRHSSIVRSVLQIALAAGLAASPALAQTAGVAAGSRETAVAPERNPPGDIPDDQVFITYRSPEGFLIEVPEGWARSDRGSGTTFQDKYGRIDIAVTRPGPTSADAAVKVVKTQEAAVDVRSAREAKLPAGTALVIDFLSNSEVNPVTDRKIRLENRRITYFGRDRNVVVTLSAPAGADNVDQWKMMAESFRWAS